MRHSSVLPIALMLFIALLLLATSAAAAPLGAPPPDEANPFIELADTGTGRANALAYSPDGQLLAVGTGTGIALYDAHSREELRYIPSTTWVRSVAFSPDGQMLAAGYYEPSVRLWRVADGALVRTLQGHTSWVRSVAFTPNGQTLLTASDDQTLRWWRVSDGAAVRTLSEGMTGVRVVALSPNGELVAAGGADGLVRLLRASDGALLRELSGHTDWIRSLAFSPDGQTLASGAFDATARLWRVSDGAALAELRGHTFSVLGVAFSPDGQTLATGSVDATIALWRVADARLMHVLTGHTGFIFAVAYAPDGQTLASGAVDNTVRLWDVGPNSGRVPLVDAPPRVPSTSCVQCHHPRGDFLRPGGITEAPPVTDVACAACHEAGTLVLHWCPAFPRAAGVSERHGSWDNLSNQVGFTSASRTFALALSAPGNGEHYNVPPIHTVLPVSGQLFGPDTNGLEVRLEVWSGSERTGTATTRSAADGSFFFSTDLRPNGIVLEVPIEERGCVMCHSETLAENPHLPPGDVRLIVSAVNSDGHVVSDERWITVDRSLTTEAVVNVIMEGPTHVALPELKVQASTRLYEWRGRTLSGSTGPGGVAHLMVETLAEVPTEYTFDVPPVVIAGRLYASVEPVTVRVPAGATTLPPVTLTVRTQSGRIVGSVAGLQAPLTVHALHLPDGARAQTTTTAAGAFEFADLALGEYLLLPDPQALAAQGLTSAAQRLDLAQSPQADVLLPTRALGAAQLQGTVTDDQGQALPFAWVTAGLEGPASAARPGTGGWALGGLDAQPRTVVASAPGFYSQAVALPPGTDPAAPVAFTLSPRPDLRWLPWGDGQIALPPETQASLDGSDLVLDRGWLWGEGGGLEPLVIRTAGLVITLPRGRFALANVPGQTAWLYTLSGEATVVRAEASSEPVELPAGTMLALSPNGELVPVPLDPLVMQALEPASATALPAVWAPTLTAQFQNRLALLGITVAQVVTFITYMSVLLSLFAVPLVRVVWWMKHTRQIRETNS